MTTNNKAEKNWTLIGCTALTTALLAFVGISSRVTTITEQYRNELLVSYMHEDDQLRVNDCERPIANAIADAAYRGKSTRLDDQTEYLDDYAKAKCLAARRVIDENEEKRRKLPITPVPTAYITKHFFG
jgi:hypothetical protein